MTKNTANLDQAVKTLKSDGVIIFPTDTVWGIGASIKSLKAIKKLYQTKNRSRNQATAVLVGSIKQAESLGEINPLARQLVAKFWPGGLTIIVKAKKNVPQIICGEKNLVGLRMPNHPLVLKLLLKLGQGIAAASANFKGQPAPADSTLLDQRLKQMADFVLEGKNLGAQASTVINTANIPPVILRQGTVRINMKLIQ